MNWRLSILPFLLVFSLGVELSSMPGYAGGEDQPHAVFVPNDDLAEAGDEGADLDAIPSFDLLVGGVWADFAWQIRTSVANMISSLDRAEPTMLCVGVRRHRWLCVERC